MTGVYATYKGICNFIIIFFQFFFSGAFSFPLMASFSSKKVSSEVELTQVKLRGLELLSLPS